MTKYIKVSEILPHKKVSLIANRTMRETHFDIIKFQPSANLSYQSDRGIYCDDEDYTNKVDKFFELVIDKQPALVLTPEGSIPFNVVNDIIENKEKWPQIGNLWCLCMSGISKKDFCDFKISLKSKENIFLHMEPNINYKAHVNSLFYLFRLEEDRLAIIIQLKNNHMSDREFRHEANDLTKGNEIYIFDLNDEEDTKNILLTFICADAIQLSVSDMVNNIKYKHPLVINAQCNSKPFDNRFIGNRSAIACEVNIPNQRYIVVNWAKGTKMGSSPFIINDSGNIYYNYLKVNGHSYLKKIFSDKDAFINRMENQIKGITYFVNDKVNIWRFPDDENILKFYIKKEEVYGTDSTLSSNFDPFIKERYNYENRKWLQNAKYCTFFDEKDLELYISENELLRPLYFQECKKKECTDKCVWLYNDFFLGICLAGDFEEELKCADEISNRTLIAMNDDSLDNTDKKRELFSILVKILEENRLPDELKIFKNNIQFEIDTNAAECGSNNIYNISVVKTPE